MFCFGLIKGVLIVRAAGAYKQPMRASEKCRGVAALDLATMPRTTAALERKKRVKKKRVKKNIKKTR